MYNSYYIEGINHLYEFDVGPESGWMYKVDEWFPNYGCLHGSDHGVVWPRAAGEAGSGEAAIRHDGGRQWGLKPAIRR